MMGELSNRGRRTTEIPKGAIMRRRPKRGRPVVAPFVSRLRARAEVPVSGRIVFRPASQILH
jgi:hypothetical protein